MYAHLIACTGWTWEYIDDFMTVPRMTEMTQYWKGSPPLHLMVAAYFGIEKPSQQAKTVESKESDEAAIVALIAGLPQVDYVPRL